MNTVKEEITHIPTGIENLDSAMEGGGFQKGKVTAILAGTGTGGGVLWMQTLASLVKDNIRGLVLSDEQEGSTLFPRFVSSALEIPFKDIRDGFENANLPEDALERVDEYLKRLNETCRLRWSGRRTQSVEDYSHMVDETAQTLGGLDLIVMTGLTHITYGHLDVGEIIDMLSKAAQKHDAAVLITLGVMPDFRKEQITPVDLSKGVKPVSGVDTFIGISCKMDAREVAFESPQYMTLSGKGYPEPVTVPVTRDFDYMRFV